jgi:hypothetical protein
MPWRYARDRQDVLGACVPLTVGVTEGAVVSIDCGAKSCLLRLTGKYLELAVQESRWRNFEVR